MRTLVIAVVLSLLALAPAGAAETLLVIVRHAEKQQDESGNPDLTAAGLARAEALAELASEYPVGGVYSTDLCRTAQTAQPTAARFGMPIAVQTSGSAAAGLDGCTPPITSPALFLDPTIGGAADLLSWILEQHPGQTVVIVGHSNTVPQMLARLGAGAVTMTDDEYDRLFLVTYSPELGTRMVESRYGAASAPAAASEQP